MPNIIYETITVPAKKRAELIKGLTETASEITSIPKEFFNIQIKDNPIENWGIGGEPLAEVLKKHNK